MEDISQIISQTAESNSSTIGKNPENGGVKTETTPVDTKTSNKEKNITDPIVAHDPTLKIEGIAKLYSNQHKVEMEDNELSTNNEYDALLTDGIMYPLVVINNRNISNNDILSFQLDYTDFVPTIKLIIHDLHETEQKINSTQMSGLIRVAMISPVDNVYKKILMNFKITNARVNPTNRSIVTYYGEYNIPKFKQINNGHIWMQNVCSKSDVCNQGGHINANTWEMLHYIAEVSNLGFACTKQCKEINDRVIRNIFSQRYDQYIKHQLLHSGLTEENIFDAWVDLYGYIVMINVAWVLNQDIEPDDLTIETNTGIHPSSNDLPDQKPQTTSRTLTNYNLTGTVSNIEIDSYNINISNDAVHFGTLEHSYSYKFKANKTELEEIDIQTKQNSIDGDFIEEYNTGKNRPIPSFDFCDDEYTGLSGGYDLNNQKTIRTAFFRKHRQSILEVVLKNYNLGLQRGTLVNIAIFDNDPINKKITFANVTNLAEASEEIEEDRSNIPNEINEEDIIQDDGAYMPNFKLSGLYYIDGMKFEYSIELGRIVQTLYLIKKGSTSGYANKHTMPKVPDSKIPLKATMPQSPPFIYEY